MKIFFSGMLALTLFSATAMATGTSAGFDLWEKDPVTRRAPPPKEPVPPGHSLVKLATMTSDQDANRTDLALMIDGSSLVAGMYNDPDPNNIDDGETKSRNVFWLKDIESSKGAVMLVKKGRNTLILKGKLDRSSQEGRFVLKYLTNGLFMTYDSCELLLKRSGSGWYVQNAYSGSTVSSIKVITHELGITTLQGLCPDAVTPQGGGK